MNLLRRELILASASPQRSEILQRLGIAFTVRPSGVEELAAGDPSTVALHNALIKARTVRSQESSQALILGVDTLLDVDGLVCGKPPDAATARQMLAKLAGRTHRVVGAVALLDGPRELTGVDVTEVTFRAVSGDVLDRYVATEEWRGRAGGYAIQGRAAGLITRINGNYENVVGLSVATLARLLPDLL